MQMSEEVPAGHMNHCHWELLRGDVYQPLQQTPCFPADDTQKRALLDVHQNHLHLIVWISLAGQNVGVDLLNM